MEPLSPNIKGQVVPDEIQTFIEQLQSDEIDIFQQFSQTPNEDPPAYVQPSIDGRDDTSTYLGSMNHAPALTSGQTHESMESVNDDLAIPTSSHHNQQWLSNPITPSSQILHDHTHTISRQPPNHQPYQQDNTSSPPRMIAEQRELKKQREQARRGSNLSARTQGAGTQGSHSGYEVTSLPSTKDIFVHSSSMSTGIGSVFSTSVHPDEDWTKISDLAERRRIQNRISRGNYRKKIKDRSAKLDRMEVEKHGKSSSKNIDHNPPASPIAPEGQLLTGDTRDSDSHNPGRVRLAKGMKFSQPSSAPVSTKEAPNKDELGPKIWTGTHFLPRFVRAAEVPGEGMCYFYDDGSHCQTVVDGETVNAHWGVTKAGKPRKRLAIACVTCREKKIKCDPDYPRCVQCEKFGLICEFKNALRGFENHMKKVNELEDDENPLKNVTDDTLAWASAQKEKVQSPVDGTAEKIVFKSSSEYSRKEEQKDDWNSTPSGWQLSQHTNQGQYVGPFGYQTAAPDDDSRHETPVMKASPCAKLLSPDLEDRTPLLTPKLEDDQHLPDLGPEEQDMVATRHIPATSAKELFMSPKDVESGRTTDTRNQESHSDAIKPDNLSNETHKPYPEDKMLLRDARFLSSTLTSADNATNTTLAFDETATDLSDTVSAPITMPRHGATVSEWSVKNARRQRRRTEPLSAAQRRNAAVLRKLGACPDCRRRRVACHPRHHEMTWGEGTESYMNHKEGSTAKESNPYVTEYREQQNYTLFQEGTVADSGYMSACAPRPDQDLKPHEDLKEHDTMMSPGEQNKLAVDQKSVYTSLNLPHGSEYISDLCNDIYLKLKNDLQERSSGQARLEMPKCLPDLIKALAIRIGLDRSNPAGPYIMQFLHVHHKDIVAQLGGISQNREESPEVSHNRPDDDGMAVLDKMRLWDRKASEESPLKHEQDGLFEGVRDEEEMDIFSDTKMAVHREYVLSSTAYQWFIGNLKKQLSLDWDSDDLSDANSFHHSIMSNMSPGIISKHRPPEIHHAKFHVKLRPGVFRYFHRGPFDNLVTFTSSAPNIVQASTLQGYLERTWSSGDMSLLKLIQMVYRAGDRSIETGMCPAIRRQVRIKTYNEPDPRVGKFDDNTSITAQIERLEHSQSTDLLVTVSGPRYSISQCGEQLAWLGAVIQTYRSGIASCTCSLESRDENEWLINYSFDHTQGNTTSARLPKAPRSGGATIIQGFPTTKRPPLFQGLELGLTWMLELIGASWPPVIENDKIVLKGFHHTLELVKQSQNVLLWHTLHSSSTSCSFCECPSFNESEKPSSGIRSNTVMWAWTSRHIVSNSEHLEAPVAAAACQIDQRIGQDCAKSETQDLDMREDPDPMLSPTEKSDNVVESSGDSLDSDMLSISSEETDCLPIIDPGNPLTLVIDDISLRIFSHYKKFEGLRSNPQSEHTGNTPAAHKAGDSSTPCTTSQSHGMEMRRTGKRGRPGNEDEDWDEGGFRKPPRPTKRPTRSPSRLRVKMLACPFWKLDSEVHRLCFHRKCSRISDVKYHLARKHKLPAIEYCQRCWTAFEGQAHKEGHLRDPLGQGCKYNPAARPVGIDNNMAAALHKKSNPSQSTEDQWFAIWDIVFPDQPRPSSPYVNNSLSEDAMQLQEIILNQWPSILASIAEEAGRSSASVNTDRLEQEHLIRATLNRLLDDFSAAQESMRAARLASNHQSPGGQTSSSSNRADSAIEIGSNLQFNQLSSNSGDDASMLTAGTTEPHLENYPPGPSLESTGMHGRRERSVLSSGQNNDDINYAQQDIPEPPPSIRSTVIHEQLRMPTPTISQSNEFPVENDVQTRSIYRTDHSFGVDFTFNDSSRPSTGGHWSQFPPGSGEYNGDISWGDMEVAAEFDWSMFDTAADNTPPHTDNTCGEQRDIIEG